MRRRIISLLAGFFSTSGRMSRKRSRCASAYHSPISLSDIVPANEHQQDLFDKPQNASLTKAIDELNEKFGKGMVGFGLAASSSRKLTSKIAFQRVPDLSEF